MKKNNRPFGGISPGLSDFDHAQILLQPIPYDRTSTWGKGADKAFEVFLDAAENMELYDIETDSEVYKKGIHILDEIKQTGNEYKLHKDIFKRTTEILHTKKFPTFLGGEHSISIEIIQAFRQKYPKLTVLQLDAHADLRKDYLGSEYNHACALHRASKNTNLIQVGIRSMDVCEKQYMDFNKCFFAEKIHDNSEWMQKSVELMTNPVYVTIDLDVFNPSILPATGTPEPGGLDWYTVLNYLKLVFKNKNVVGFDIVEHSPISNFKAPDFLVAKLYYKLLSYKFYV